MSIGGMGTNNMRAFLSNDDVQVLAVCDPVKANDQYGHWYKRGFNGDWFGREPTKTIVEEHYAQNKASDKFKACDAYIDFRKIIERDNIDTVCITTPDHWHAIIAIAAAKTRSSSSSATTEPRKAGTAIPNTKADMPTNPTTSWGIICPCAGEKVTSTKAESACRAC